MSVEFCLRPIEPDTRTWLEKLLGYKYTPQMPLTQESVSDLLQVTRQMNDMNAKNWRCRIRRVHIPPKGRS